MAKVRTSGTFRGKSNKLGYGGRAVQLKAQGVPGGVIGNLARAAGAVVLIITEARRSDSKNNGTY